MLYAAAVVVRLLRRQLVAGLVASSAAGFALALLAGLTAGIVDAYTAPLEGVYRGRIVVSSLALSPATSTVDTGKVLGLLESSGANYTYWVEVMAPVMVNGSGPYIVRGLPPGLLARVTGDPLAWSCKWCIWAGSTAARRLRVKEAGIVLMDSVFAPGTVAATIAGVVEAEPPYDEELLASLDLARLLRGLRKDSVASIVVVEPATPKDRARILKALASNGRLPGSLAYRALVIVLRRHGGVAGSPEQMYMARIGLAPRLILVAGVVAASLLAVSLHLVPRSILSSSWPAVKPAWQWGLPKTALRAVALTLTSIGVSVGALLEHIVAPALEPIAPKVLGHSAKLCPETSVLLAALAATLLSTLYGTLSWEPDKI